MTEGPPASTIERGSPRSALALVGLTCLVTGLTLVVPSAASPLDDSSAGSSVASLGWHAADAAILACLTVGTLAALVAWRERRPEACWGAAVATAAALAPLWTVSSRVPDRAVVPLVSTLPFLAPGVAMTLDGWAGRPSATKLRRVSWAAACASPVVAVLAYNPFRDAGCVFPCRDLVAPAQGLADGHLVTGTLLGLAAMSTAAALVDTLVHGRGAPAVLRAASAAGLMMVLAASLVAGIRPEDRQARVLLLWAALSAMLLVSAALLVAAWRAGSARRALGRLVARLDDPTAPLKAGLPAAGLEVQYAMPGGETWVDASGLEVDEHVSDAIMITLAEDRAAVRVRSLSPRTAADAAARLMPADLVALSNARAAAIARAHQRKLEESRRRIEVTTDQERRRIERDLHDGAQQRLVSVKLHLKVAESELPSATDHLRRAEAEVGHALVQLRSLAHGRGHRTDDSAG